MHYQRRRKTMDMTAPIRIRRRNADLPTVAPASELRPVLASGLNKCSVEGCERPTLSKISGLCRTHHQSEYARRRAQAARAAARSWICTS